MNSRIILRHGSIIGAALLLQACVDGSTTRWTQTHGSQTYSAAEYRCKAEAQAAARARKAERQSDSTIRCSGYDMYGTVSVRCRESSGGGGSPLAAFLLGAVEGLSEIKDFERCMAANGWEKRTVTSTTANLSPSTSAISPPPRPLSPKIAESCPSDPLAWKNARSIDTEIAYWNYIRNCKPAIFVQDALIRIGELQTDERN